MNEQVLWPRNEEPINQEQTLISKKVGEVG